MGAPLSSWPWENLGSHKYWVFGPFVAQVVKSWMDGESLYSNWCFHILVLCTLRGVVHQLWLSFSNMNFISEPRRINHHPVDFNQIDAEWHWDNFIILQALAAAISWYMLPSSLTNADNLLPWDGRGFIIALILHVVISEPLYYWFHTSFHGQYLFTNYHRLHHSAPVLTPFTEAHATFLEHLLLIPIVGIPVLVTYLIGHGSVALIYGYILGFDFLRCLGHCNAEIVPHQIFEAVPLLKYLIYTPTYHNIHHTEKDSNFCLFMPLFDKIGNTLNPKSWELHKEMRLNRGKNVRVPDFVFLAHMVDVCAALHTPFLYRSFASIPYSTKLFMLPLWLPTFIVVMMMWAWAKSFAVSKYFIQGKLQQTWAIPRFGVQYFLPFAKKGINKQIENAILKADKIGVKVLSLAALNKNEALNGGGTLFVNKHPNLRVRVVHGNTLTAAVIINEIGEDVKEVFLTGATSKLGRAIALYLCRKRVRVLMLTLSTERFQKIQKEAPDGYQKYLVQVTKYQAAKNCKTWIVGKWITPREQNWAPTGAHFHQFVVPPILHFRRDCTYGDLAAMRLPQDVKGLGVCEAQRERQLMDQPDQQLMSAVSEAHPDTMDFLSRAWCNFAVQAFQPPDQVEQHPGTIIPFDPPPHQRLFSMNDTDAAPFLMIERGGKMDGGDTNSTAPWGSNDQLKSWLWMQQALHPEVNYNGGFRKKWFPWKITPFKNMSMRKWLKEIKEKRKEEQRLQNAQVHAAVSIAGLATALAAIAAERSPGHSMDTNCCTDITSRDIAVASAAALVASQCAKAAELLGAKKEQIRNVIGSAMNGTNTSDIVTLTAAATTSLRGAATLKARTGYRNRLNGNAPVLPIEEHNVSDDIDFEDNRSILAKGAQFNIETPDGKRTVRLASLQLSGEGKVILKTRKPNLLSVMTGKREYLVLDLHVELYKDTAARDDDIETESEAGPDSSTCYQMVLTTTKGSIKLDMADDYQRYKMWTTTISHMLMLSTSLNKYQHRFSKY